MSAMETTTAPPGARASRLPVSRGRAGETPALPAKTSREDERSAWGRRADDRAGDLDPADLLGAPAERPGIAGTAYDTAWLALVPAASGEAEPRFPAALRWLSENQQPDGSWGGAIRYEHDRVLCTLVAISALAAYGRRRADRLRVAAGTRYLWQRGHLLGSEPVELVGFELLLPTLVQRARRLGVAVPPHLDIYRRQRAAKLSLLPAEVLYSARTTAAHSLEFLGDDADPARLREALGPNGAIGNSPAATAFYLARNDDRRAQAYLEECLRRGNGATAPVLYPCETFELLWAAYHLFLGGIPAGRLLGPIDREVLVTALREQGGVSLSPTFAIPDADDTAVALLLLHALGETVDVGILRAFAVPAGYFASFPYERHSSVGVNLHVLHALLRVPGYPDLESTIEHLVDYLLEQQMGGLYWIDKWHISPYYATAHAVCCLRELRGGPARRVRPALDRAREWLRQTQNADGSWGFYGTPTAEETAYAVLALASENRVDGRDLRRIAAALRLLPADGATNFPPLWIDKCLYTPTLVVRAAIEAARAIGTRVVAATDFARETARPPATAALAS